MIELRKIHAGAALEKQQLADAEEQKLAAERIEWIEDIEHPSHIQGRKY